MITPTQIDFTIWQGSTVRQGFEMWLDEARTEPFDPEGWEVRSQVRQKIDAPDFVLGFTSSSTVMDLGPSVGTAEFQKVLNETSELIKTILWLNATPAQTSAVQIKRGAYDIELIDSMGNVGRAFQGAVLFSPEVTRNEKAA